MPQLCLLLFLGAVAEDGNLEPGRPYRAAFEREHPAALMQARSLHSLGMLPQWRREGRAAEQVFGSLLNWQAQWQTERA